MSFINIYNKEDQYFYNNSIKIGNVIYSIGCIQNSSSEIWDGLIIKTDSNGIVIWEKRYIGQEGFSFDFLSIVGCDNGDILILGNSLVGPGNYLTRIGSAGEVIWQKFFERMFAVVIDEVSTKLIKIGYETYVLHLFNGTKEHLGNPMQNFIFKLDYDGNIIAQKSIIDSLSRSYFKGIIAISSKIVLYGYSTLDPSDVDPRPAVILELDFNLEVIGGFFIEDTIDLFEIINIIPYNQGYVILGKSFATAGSFHFLTKIPFSSPAGTISVKQLFLTSPYNLHANATSLYLHTADRDIAVVSKLNYNFDVQWTKRYTFPYYHTGTAFIRQVTENGIIFIDGRDEFTPISIGSVNLELNSCHTTVQTKISMDTKTLEIRTAENYTVTNTVFQTSNHLIVAEPVISIKEEVCPTEIDDPCIKDALLCQLNTDVATIYESGNFEVPNKNQADYSVFVVYIQEIQSLVAGFSNDNPFYQLQVHFFKQLTALQVFLTNQNYKNYAASWEAIQYILNYLSQVGNCSCTNNVKITDFAQFQSSHFYIQAAGSTGADSPMGIQLRWALKGALSEHLPKGNYAISDINFNKKDDFVKIYRSAYDTTFPVLLDFNTAPDIINDITAIKFWIYKVGTKIFHINFIDTGKYIAAKALHNPTEGAIAFLTAYGDGVIEIENKKELAFAVTPYLIVEDEESVVKVELLSVEDNKITAAKGASLRQTYTAGNSSTVKIFSENIRSIRFSTQAVMEKIEFECYSDFIRHTTTNETWTYLGKQALSKDENIVFERLEPQEGILESWLRYNNHAYVNVENYKTKWNGANLPEGETIVDSVDKYITLSNAIENPTGIEKDLIEGSDFEISNLHLLQMGALDFHIARMLGLGILDLDEGLEQGGKWVYMAEYTTYANLQDGLGAREVQHMYCSLPTSIEDQRLPIALDLKEPVPGITYGEGTESAVVLTDENGYSQDGKTRFLSLYHQAIPEEELNQQFYYQDITFISAESTIPVFAGIEYKPSHSSYRKPELSYDRSYFNLDTTVSPEFRNETRPIIIPEPGYPLFVHREKESGPHTYGSYGINWFSRAKESDVIYGVQTDFIPANLLLPPTNVNAFLIKEENPLFLTSGAEQLMLAAINTEQPDKTLVRITFDYNHGQELLDYQKAIDGELIDGYNDAYMFQEPFAENVEVFFRNKVPVTISGKIIDVIENPENALTVAITTGPFSIASSGSLNEQLVPVIPNGMANHFVGSVLLAEGNEYLIHEVDTSGTYPKFTVFVLDVSGKLVDSETTQVPDEIKKPVKDGLFLVVENMLNTTSWGTQNPFSVILDLPDRHSEEITIITPDGINETHVQKFRGVYSNTLIEKVLEQVNTDLDNPESYVLKHLGIYKVTFFGFSMPQHTQYQQGENSVEWLNGIVRIHTESDAAGPRKEFMVLNAENIGNAASDLVLHICDLSFPSDTVEEEAYEGKIMGATVNSIEKVVNYYPGYKVYLYKDAIEGLSAGNILPDQDLDEDIRYSIFGLRSHDFPEEYYNDNTVDYYSKMSVPTLMYAQAITAPLVPDAPLGGTYATRPDFFGKSSYTFKTKLKHKPHSVQFNRGSDIQILSSLYNNSEVDSGNETIISTLQKVMVEIFQNGEEPMYVNRWNNLLDFTTTNADFLSFEHADGIAVKLPLPDSPNFIASINAFIDDHNEFYKNLPSKVAYIASPILSLNTIVIPEVFVNGKQRNGKLLIRDFMKDSIHNCFVPLTEIPVIYKYIKGINYTPIPKKQVVRDRNGNLLTPTDNPAAEFDMAPMMKITDVVNNVVQFTDFGLDGASNARYFYTAREINIQLKTSEYSPIMGPISLVNSAPPTAPEIIKIIPVLENRILGISPAIQLQINSYSVAQNIKKITIYRATNITDALTVRTMKQVKVIDVENEGIADEMQWIFTDDFTDASLIPYGDPLFYRITVSRVIKYTTADGETVTDYAPSEASKFVLTNVPENYSPESPTVQYASEPVTTDGILNFVNLYWQETVYKGLYHIYKMNNQGNWVEISRVVPDRLIKGRYYIYKIDISGNWIETTAVTSANETIYLPLELTNLDNYSLSTKGSDGDTIYHHFKVIAENTSGMFSNKENILTIYNLESWNDIGGIGAMIIEGTFIIR